MGEPIEILKKFVKVGKVNLEIMENDKPVFAWKNTNGYKELVESVEYAIREMERLQEYEEYCQKTYKKIEEAKNEISGLRYSLSLNKNRLSLDETEEELIEYLRELKDNVEEPENLIVSIYSKGIFRVFDYIPKSKIREIINNHYPDVAVQKITEILEKEGDE